MKSNPNAPFSTLFPHELSAFTALRLWGIVQTGDGIFTAPRFSFVIFNFGSENSKAWHKRESFVAFFPCFYRLYICIWWLCSCMYETDHFHFSPMGIHYLHNYADFNLFSQKRKHRQSHNRRTDANLFWSKTDALAQNMEKLFISNNSF